MQEQEQRKLIELLNLLGKNGYRPRKMESIKYDIISKDKKINILNDDSFNILWDVTANKLILSTSYSNQIIDQKLVNKINWLYDRVTYYNI